MIYLAQVNFGANFASLLGVVYCLLGIVYPIAGLLSLFSSRDEADDVMFLFRLLQLILVPFIILLCGAILFFQGWRLDAPLQFQQFLLFILVVYLLFKETLLNILLNNR